MYGAYWVPSTLQTSTHFILTATLGSRYYYCLYFYRLIELQKGDVLQSSSVQVLNLGRLATGILWWVSCKESICQLRRHGFDPWVGKLPWRRAWQPTPVFLPEESPWTEELGGLQSLGSHKIQTWLSDWAHAWSWLLLGFSWTRVQQEHTSSRSDSAICTCPWLNLLVSVLMMPREPLKIVGKLK